MFGNVQIAAIALALTILAGGALCYRRRAARCPSHSRLAGTIVALAACACLLGAGALVSYAWVFFPAAGTGGSTLAVTPPETDTEADPVESHGIPDPDERFRRLAIGTWTDNYQGKRTMTLRADGTGTMVVQLSGLSATLFAARLQFEMVWSVENGCLKKQTTGGEPADKVRLILKMMGDRADEPILEIDEDRLVLLDNDGTTKYNWTRVLRSRLPSG